MEATEVESPADDRRHQPENRRDRGEQDRAQSPHSRHQDQRSPRQAARAQLLAIAGFAWNFPFLPTLGKLVVEDFSCRFEFLLPLQVNPKFTGYLAFTGFLLALANLGFPAWQVVQAYRLPPINDITTDIMMMNGTAYELNWPTISRSTRISA